MAVRSLQAEYLLKSAVNAVRSMLKEDISPEDSKHDMWGSFLFGQAIPPSVLGLDQQNVLIELELRPEEAKLPLHALVPSSRGRPNLRWRAATVRLFQRLGFDDDGETVKSGPFRGQFFDSEKLVAILIDYMDRDKETYSPTDFSSGIEGELPEDSFPNKRLRRVGELANIPGFTPKRVRVLQPYVTAYGSTRININLAPKEVFLSLSDQLDDYFWEALTAFREEIPFTRQNQKIELSEIIGDDIYNEISTMITSDSRWFQIISKVDYGTSTYFMRAYLSRSGQEQLPAIRSIELF